MTGRLPAQIRLTALFSALGFIFLVLIPRDPDAFSLFGYTPVRLGMMAGFLVLTAGLLMVSQRIVREERLMAWLARLHSLPALREALYTLCAVIAAEGPALIWWWASTTDLQVKGILFRLLPVLLFLTALAYQVLLNEPTPAGRLRWLLSIGFTLAFAALSLALPPLLAGQIDEPLKITYGMRFASLLLPSGTAALLFPRILSLPPAEQRPWGWILALAAALYGLQWVLLTDAYAFLLPILTQFGVALILGAALLTYIIDRLSGFVRSFERKWLNWLLPLSFLMACVPLVVNYHQAASLHARQVNVTTIHHDQGDYLDFAREARLRNFRYTGDHNRMPGYPFLQGLFYRAGMSDEMFFEQGKQVNILLSLALLAAICLFVRRWLSPALAMLFTGITAFSLFVFKAGYFQAELLYYSLAFAGFALMLELLHRPRLNLALSAGFILGLAHLTKASVLLGIAVFIAVYSLKELPGLFSRRTSPGQVGSARYRWITLLALVLAFTAAIYPYIHTVKARFGRYLYNVNTTFFIWYDSFEEAAADEKIHNFASQWPSHLPPEELPGLRKYLREHDLSQIIARMWNGVVVQVKNLIVPYSVLNYWGGYLLVLLVAALLDWRTTLRLVRQSPYALLFVLLYLAVYFASFAWYTPIASGRRFTYTIYLPYLFAVFTGLQALAAGQPTGSRTSLPTFVRLAHILITLTLVASLPPILTRGIFYDLYGS